MTRLHVTPGRLAALLLTLLAASLACGGLTSASDATATALARGTGAHTQTPPPGGVTTCLSARGPGGANGAWTRAPV